ncbi:MAG: M1 family metallopeptidase [Saprospiraceae bacterium]|nr:M1 family metallopeptidase [Saprospiraceae bacterium]
MYYVSRFPLWLLMLSPFWSFAQPDRWQQSAKYVMDIDFDVATHRYVGQQTLSYENHSPDTLYKVFYHMYFNAFQPNSMMDVRSRTITDPDRRVGSRIYALSEEEIGYQKVNSLTQNGTPVAYEMVGTILEVTLSEPILPGTTHIFEMNHEAQVPIQVRRSGRDSREGIDYSMAQWYPKMAEYDYQGWHANPYIGREFYGIWGDFDVTIHIDRDYIIGATGILQNPEEIGYGYEDEGMTVNRPEGAKLSWRFVAENVHDFVWGADPDYTHTKFKRDNGTMLHFFYQEGDRTTDNWEMLPAIMDAAFDYINGHFGQYQYKKYSFIQGGDGGMEYPMATLITGERSLGSLVGVSVHELMHSWYQMMLGTNESLYPWMDEGFTSYATNRVMNELARSGALPGRRVQENPHVRSYAGYINLARTDVEEALSTHSDHYNSNGAYGVASYSKGAVFLHQLSYIIGKEAFDQALLRYFYTWKGKHPNDIDFIRIMEKESGLELDWYREYFVNTTQNIDYSIGEVMSTAEGSSLILRRMGGMPMPVDVEVALKSGEKYVYTIPLRMMRGNKPLEAMYADMNYTVAEDWPWTHPSYALPMPFSADQIQEITLDPSGRLADVDRSNNSKKF